MRRLFHLLFAACLIASGLTLIADSTKAPTASAATSCPPPASQLINASFEAPVLTNNTYQQLKDSQVPGWSTTATDQLIEIWKSGFNGVPAAAGLQFAEINATQNASLLQDIPTTPGQTLTWGLSHRGRQGVDTMHVEIGTVGGSVNYNSDPISDGTGSWGRHTGTYTVPAGQYTTRFAFVADSTAGGNKSVGNFLDDISFGTPACVTATKSVYPSGAVHVGDTLTYVVTVTNQGGAATSGLEVNDVIPANTTYVANSASPSGSLSGSTLTMQPQGVSGISGVLEAGASANVSFQVVVGSGASNSSLHNTATVAANNGISIDTFSTNDVTSSVSPSADLELKKSFDNGGATPNNGLIASNGLTSVKFRISNLGPNDASQITLSDIIPSSLIITGSLPSGCSTAVINGNTVLTCVLSSLALSQTNTITIGVTAATTASPIEVFNTARISSASYDPNPINDTSVAPISIEPVPSTPGTLRINKIGAPTATYAGGKAGWIITVHNDGDQPTATAVYLDDLLVPGAYVVTSITVAPRASNISGDPPVTCQLLQTHFCTFPSGIQAGNSYTIILDGYVDSQQATGTLVTNQAILSNGESANAAITQNNVADVVVLKNLTTAAVAGEPLGYQVTVINAGPNDALNTYITDTLPEGTSLLNTPSGCSVSGQTLSCQLGDIASGSTQTLFYQVSIPNVGGTFTNHVVATSDTPFLDATTPEDSVTVTIPGLANTGSPKLGALPLGLALTVGGVMLFVVALRRRRMA